MLKNAYLQVSQDGEAYPPDSRLWATKTTPTHMGERGAVRCSVVLFYIHLDIFELEPLWQCCRSLGETSAHQLRNVGGVTLL